MRFRSINRKPNGSVRGFTLLEAILALGVFGIAVVGLFNALNEISLATIESAEVSQVTERMRTYMTEILRNPSFPPREPEQETEPDADGFIFRATVEETPMQTESGTELRQMYTVRIEAFRQTPQGRSPAIDEVTTYRFAPLYRQ